MNDKNLDDMLKVTYRRGGFSMKLSDEYQELYNTADDERQKEIEEEVLNAWGDSEEFKKWYELEITEETDTNSEA